MKKRIIISILIILLLSINSNSVSSDNLNYNFHNKNLTDLPNYHYIHGLNYTHQIENYFCYLTSYYMIFDYMGINTSIEEIIYYYGMGYSIYYPGENDANLKQRLPVCGRGISMNKLVGQNLGVKQNVWAADLSNSGEEIWQQYWNKVKENISNDIPVCTVIDPLSLPSLRDQFKMPAFIWDVIMGEGVHFIVLTAYNESNQTVCYNDPNAGHYGKDCFGDHAWMDIEQFKTACRDEVDPSLRYSVITWKKISERLPVQDAFNYTHKINLEKLKGNHTAYELCGLNVSQRPNALFGIDAAKRLKQNYEKGIDNRVKTIKLYKKYAKLGFYYKAIHKMQTLFEEIYPNNPSIFDILNVSEMTNFENILMEKKHMAKYLTEISVYNASLKKEADLFKQDAENWTIISDCYKEFLNKGFFLSLTRANYLMNKMESTMKNIISIEESIINGLGGF